MRQNNRSRRTAVVAVGVVTALGMLACGGERDQGVMTADLERDLQLAVQARPPQTAVVSALEGGPTNAPSGTNRGRRDAVPTPRRMPRPTPQAEVQEVAATPQLEEAAAPAVAVSDVLEPTPAPIPEPAIHAPSPDPEVGISTARGPSAGHGDGEGQGEAGAGTGRRGGGWGTLIGVIIRGGSAGVDNCEEHDRRRAGRNGRRGGVITVGEVMGGARGGVLGGAIGGVIANGGGVRPTFPRY